MSKRPCQSPARLARLCCLTSSRCTSAAPKVSKLKERTTIIQKLLYCTLLIALATLVACAGQRQTPTPVPVAEAPTAAPVQLATTEQPMHTITPMATAEPKPQAYAATAQPAPTPIAIPEPPLTPGPAPGALAPVWLGITVAPENRCSPYDSDDYPYPASVEPQIVDEVGGIYGPYTGTWFESIRETDIEHIVARSEAHDSGLCAATAATRKQFASDLLNLTLASPGVNRHQKVAHDASKWLPDLNECWYVNRVVQVRLQYGLTIDRAEADAIDQVLTGCESTEMIILEPGAAVAATATPIPTSDDSSTPTPTSDADALALYDDNRNGQITCREARDHGIAPVHRGHPAYQYMRDADDDGVVCE